MKKIVFIVTILMAYQTIQAQEEIIKDSSLKRLIVQAVNNFPKIKELQEQLNATGVKAQLINSNFQPIVSADAGYQFVAPVPEVSFGAGNVVRFQPYNNYNGGISLKHLNQFTRHCVTGCSQKREVSSISGRIAPWSHYRRFATNFTSKPVEGESSLTLAPMAFTPPQNISSTPTPFMYHLHMP